MGTIEERKKRLETTKNIFIEEKEIEYDKAVALVSYKLGVNIQRAKEYINVLIGLGLIKNDTGVIVYDKTKDL